MCENAKVVLRKSVCVCVCRSVQWTEERREDEEMTLVSFLQYVCCVQYVNVLLA